MWRGALIWLSAHVFLALAAGDLSTLSIKGSASTAAVAFAVSMFDARRRRETGFLANLGVPWTIPPAVGAATVIALELLAVGLRKALS